MWQLETLGWSITSTVFRLPVLVLVTTGLLLVHAGRLMLRLFPDDGGSPKRQRLVAAVPVVSAAIMTLLGVVATLEGLNQLGMMRFF